MQREVEECTVRDRKEVKRKSVERERLCVCEENKKEKENMWKECVGVQRRKEENAEREREKECGEREGRERKNMDKREGGIE